ncbi:branched-chain amino acid ABC transporter permease [Terrilactibacillus sp. BCM23-1]|uniref:Branched-chain amino acid ABC transporter permease n=1 Tax=Terrilactibacillus tamarindi TaxID=2599694 RepID=A0A6N8CTA4_9BACI|nr:branched-chain amino acid ABC transporter permease [Terrilactibacillus tamarindi]MTT32185.1 branched-chain amino acid ABC transporter permease [Terrilactibacillus tamarindi]
MSILDLFYQFMNDFSFLILSAIGLAIIFGMMKIINLSHGEFIMLGAYMTTLFTKAGMPLILSIFISAIGVGVFGFIIDRLVISHLYGRTLDSVVVTWGISMVLQQGMLIIFGPSLQGVSTPLGSLSIGGSAYSIYRLLLFVISFVVLVLLYVIFMNTKFGLYSRATMQNQEIAQSMGVNTNRVYSLTFSLGAAFAGLTGGLYAPTMTISPSFGTSFLMPSFVTVIVGGANPLIGTSLSGGVLGIVSSILDALWGTFYGRLGLLIVAIIVIRILPLGISGLVEKVLVRKNRV